MLEQETKQIQELMDMVLDAILVIQERTSHIRKGDDEAPSFRKQMTHTLKIKNLKSL